LIRSEEELNTEATENDHKEQRVTRASGDLVGVTRSKCCSFLTANASTARRRISTGRWYKAEQSVLELYILVGLAK